MSTALRQHINMITIEAHWKKKQQYKLGNVNMVDFEVAG